MAPPRQRDSAALTEHILEVVEGLAREAPFEQVTNEAICIAADVSASVLYRRFPTREALLDALVARYGSAVSGMAQRVVERIAQSELELEEALRVSVTMIVEFQRSNRLLESALFRHERTRRQLRPINSGLEDEAADLLAERFGLSGVGRQRLELMVFGITAMTRKLIDTDRPTSPKSWGDEVLIDHIVELYGTWLRES